MYFKPYYLGCLSHASYLIGGDNGAAAVIDPRRDVDEYIADAEAAGLAIRYVVETHLHADFVSGHTELAKRTGATILIGASAKAQFAHQPIHHHDSITLGDVTLTFLETPGHTPESVTVLLTARGDAAPRAAFTGDTLFIGDVGRPDLAGGRGLTPQAMAAQLYASLRNELLPLPDSMEVWPAHGAGSACGKALSEERVSTLGTQRTANVALAMAAAGDEAGFVKYTTEGLAEPPRYFTYDANKNREGAADIAALCAAAVPLSPAQVEAQLEETVVLDVRSVAEFGAGHVPGSIHVQLEGKFASWVGNVLSPEWTTIVVCDEGQQHEAIVRLARVGYERIAGWMEGGMEAWRNAGGEVVVLPQLSVYQLAKDLVGAKPLAVLDVRADSEWDAGHIPTALHIPLPELAARVGEVPAGDTAVMCGSGYRSSIACSLLQRAGRGDVVNVTGGWEAWVGAVDRAVGGAVDGG